MTVPINKEAEFYTKESYHSITNGANIELMYIIFCSIKQDSVFNVSATEYPGSWALSEDGTSSVLLYIIVWYDKH